MRTETMSFETAGGPTSAYVAMPDAPSGRSVILIHEWWGLNDHIQRHRRALCCRGLHGHRTGSLSR